MRMQGDRGTGFEQRAVITILPQRGRTTTGVDWANENSGAH
jgi:hypothetical protein